MWLDVEPSELEVTVTVEAPSAIVQLVTESNYANAAGKAAIEHADTLRREAARKLPRRGLPDGVGRRHSCASATSASSSSPAPQPVSSKSLRKRERKSRRYIG